MGIQLRGGGGNSNNKKPGSNNGMFGSGEIEETQEMKDLRMKREADAVAAKQAIAQKQEEMRQKALVLEQMEAAKKAREQQRLEEEELRNNPALAAERERRIAAEKAAEEQRARFKAEEEAKIAAERRVQEKKMNQTDALIAAIRAQVEKEKAQKDAQNQKQATVATPSKSVSSSSGEDKPQFRTISPEEMARLEEKKRLKAAGIDPSAVEKPAPKPEVKEEPKPQPSTAGVGVSGGLGGLGNGPSLSNPTGNGPTLSNINAGQQTLGSSGIQGGGLGIDITANMNASSSASQAEENTVALNTEEINAAMEKSKTPVEPEPVVAKPVTPEPVVAKPVTPEPVKPHVAVPEPVKVVGGASTIIVDDGNSWGSQSSTTQETENDDVSWVASGATPTQVHANEPKKDSAQKAFVDANGDIISVVPVRQRPMDSNDVQSAYNIDFDDDDDDEISLGNSAAEEEARRKAEEEEARRKAEEEEARRKAEEEARRKAEEEEARRKAEEEARRKAEEEEARRKAEEEARRKAEEEEARRKAEEEARRKAEEEEARRKAEEEARRKAEEEAKQKAAMEAMSGGFTLPVGAEQFLGKYLSVTAINDQIANTMKYISENPNEPRNIVVLGQYGFGTTTIAEDFARSFYAMGLCKTKTIAKIKAGALNRANISDAISKLQGGCLVVENAGVISNEKLDEIYQIVSDSNNDVVVIMTGQIETLSRIFKDNVVISSQFKHLIQVHRITDMDVFTIAKNHAMQSGYPCEAAAENNLRRRMQEVESGNLDRVLKIVDNAVSKAHNREMISGDQEHRLVPADFEL